MIATAPWSPAPGSTDMRILILGGTQEAFALAEQLADVSGVEIISSLAGRTREPRIPRGQVRVGGFGGAEGLARYLREERISHLINATHPFAAQMSMGARGRRAGTDADDGEGAARPADVLGIDDLRSARQGAGRAL